MVFQWITEEIKNRMKTCAGIFISILMLALLQSLAFAEPGTVVTDGGRLNMRKSPEDRAKIVIKIKNGSQVEVLETVEEWYRISFDGKEGYVKSRYIKLLSSAVGTEIYSNGTTLYLREEPSEKAAIVGMINAQQAMTLERVDEQWALVSNQNVKGYVQLSQINELNDSPAEATEQAWISGILQSETKLYKAADSKSEVVATWPKGTGVSVSSYDKNWCMVQVLDETSFGFAKKETVKLTSMPVDDKTKELVDESKFISASKAKKTAEKALKKYSGFKSSLNCKQDSVLSSDGIRGPMFRFIYTNKAGQYLYAAYIHAYTGDVLYTGDYSNYAGDVDVSDLRTSPPKTTQDPQWWYDEEGNVVWDTTPEPQTGTDIGQSTARSIADRYLTSKYPRFSQTTFSRVRCIHIEDPTNSGGFKTPYYQFDYFVDDGAGDSMSEQLAYEIIIHAYTKEIEYCTAASFGEGNG